MKSGDTFSLSAEERSKATSVLHSPLTNDDLPNIPESQLDSLSPLHPDQPCVSGSRLLDAGPPQRME